MGNIEIYKVCLVVKSFTRRKTLTTKKFYLPLGLHIVTIISKSLSGHPYVIYL